MQHRLVYHHTSTDGSSTYQANSTASYSLLRTGRLIELAGSKLGKIAATAITEVTLLGFATITELEDRTLEILSTSCTESINGHVEEDLSRTSLERKVREDVRSLLRTGFLKHVRPVHFQAHFDARQDAEKTLKSQGVLPSLKGRKGQIEIEVKIDSELQRRTVVNTPEYGTTRKRTLDEVADQPVPKRQRLSDKKSAKPNGITGSAFVQDRVDSNILVCANFRNLVSQIRDDLVIRKARKCLGSTPSRVIESALLLIPSVEPWDESMSEYHFNLEDLHDNLTQQLNFPSINGNYQNGDHPNGMHEDVAVNSEEGELSYGEIDRCLALLADSDFNFLHGKMRSEQWTVKKKELDEYVQKQEILRMMGDRLGPPALRVVRMLIEKGKLDEKSLQEIGLLGAKDLRQTLAQLKQMGYVDLQEVPREAQRQPNRTIFLWFHDSERVRKVLLENLYKAMSRLMQRLKFEKAKLSSTLEKIERTDVQGREESAMSEAELRVLKRWYKKEKWLLGEVCRLDESVALLRDQ